MPDESERLSVGHRADRAIGLLEKAESVRLDAQRKAQDAAFSGDLSRLRDDPSSVLGSAEELNRLKHQFDVAFGDSDKCKSLPFGYFHRFCETEFFDPEWKTVFDRLDDKNRRAFFHRWLQGRTGFVFAVLETS